MARPFFRNLGTLTMTAGQVTQLDIPRNHVFKRLLIRLSGRLVISGGTTNGTLNSEDCLALLPSIRVVRNGSEILQDLDGGSMVKAATFNNGTAPRIVAIGSPAPGTYDFSASIPVDFSSERLYTPGMTLAKAVGTSSFQLHLTWGSTASLISGGDRVLTLTAFGSGSGSPSAIVHGVEIMDLSGTFGDKVLRAINKPVTITQPDFEMILTTGPLYRRLIFKSWTQSQFVLVDNLVNSLRVVVDGALYLADRYSWSVLQDHNKEVYGLETAPVGYAVLDFAEDGNPQGLLNTAGASEIKVLADVTLGTGNCNLICIPEVIISAPSGAAVPA